MGLGQRIVAAIGNPSFASPATNGRFAELLSECLFLILGTHIFLFAFWYYGAGL